jgi:type III pantothenate kinase
MNADVVADIGNTRVKWGRCAAGAVAEVASLSPDEPSTWQAQLDAWELRMPLRWAVTGVHPGRVERLDAWLRERGDTVRVINDPRELPLRVALERPERVGIDRLLDAVAANSRRPVGTPAVVIDAGSAVTVDWIDETGAFQGGAILPGLRLMAQSLHDYTALLPLVEPPRRPPPLPGKGSSAAIEAGVYWAVVGGVAALFVEYTKRSKTPPVAYFTGGDAPALLEEIPWGEHWPAMTLEGIRLTAEVLP